MSSLSLPPSSILPKRVASHPLLKFHQPTRIPSSLPSSSSFRFRSSCSSVDTPASVVHFEEFIEEDWSFIETEDGTSVEERNDKANRTISAGNVGENSRVLVSLGTEDFVDRFVESSHLQLLLVVHYSLFQLAMIKEKHDGVKCWQGELVEVPEKWAPFDTVFLCYLPALNFSLDRIFGTLARRCSPGARVVISYSQGRERVQQQRRQNPALVKSDLPDKAALEKAAADNSFQITEFVDEPALYLAVLQFC